MKSATSYHKVTRGDCLSVATREERAKLDFISPMDLLLRLARRWCRANGYRLGGYLGSWCWDAAKVKQRRT